MGCLGIIVVKTKGNLKIKNSMRPGRKASKMSEDDDDEMGISRLVSDSKISNGA